MANSVAFKHRGGGKFTPSLNSKPQRLLASNLACIITNVILTFFKKKLKITPISFDDVSIFFLQNIAFYMTLTCDLEKKIFQFCFIFRELNRFSLT